MLKMSKWKPAALFVFAFAASGPLQHVGAIPQTAIGDASKVAIKSLLNIGASEAFAACGGFHVKGNNGFGNGGFDPAPGNSGANGSPNSNQKKDDVVR